MKHALLAPLLWLALAVPALAEAIPLDTLSRYLGTLTTAEAQFTQLNPDGSTSTGRLFIQRPGRMRFEYDPPENALVLASGGQVAIFDAKSNQPPEQYPLSRTPLNLILGRDIDLAGSRMVVGHAESEGTTRVVAQDPEHPEYGTLTLIFTDGPVTLRQWIVVDDVGNQTAVLLGPLRLGESYQPSLFSIHAEASRRGLNR